MNHDDSILSYAIPVAETKGWQTLDYGYGSFRPMSIALRESRPSHLWLNEFEILNFRRNTNGFQPWKTKLSHDAKTVFSEAMPGIELKGNPEPVSISRDARCLLWFQNVRLGVIEPKISSLEGLPAKSFRKFSWTMFTWSMDGNELLFPFQTQYSFGIASHNVHTNKTRIVNSASISAIVNTSSEMGLPSSDVVRVVGYDRNSNSSLNVYECSLTNSSFPVKEFPMPLKKNGSENTALISPSGDKLLVLVERYDVDFWHALNQKALQILRQSNYVESGIFYVYDMNGNRKELGKWEFRYSPKPPYDIKPESMLGGLKWMPDSKNISFIYQGMLYKLPVK